MAHHRTVRGKVDGNIRRLNRGVLRAERQFRPRAKFLDGLILLVAVLAGLLGGLLGLGGGVILVPALSSAFGMPLSVAVGTSLIAVAATSVSSTVSYVRQGLTDVQLGVGLVAVTSLGAVVGGTLGLKAGAGAIAVVFFLLTVYTGFVLMRREWFPGRAQKETPRRPAPAYGLMLLSGALSGLLGIGGGPVNVPVMNLLLSVPLKRATATSSFMVGVTAATGGMIYFFAGRVDLMVAGLCVVGVAVGAQAAAAVQKHLPTRWLALIFAVLLVAVGLQMVVAHA